MGRTQIRGCEAIVGWVGLLLCLAAAARAGLPSIDLSSVPYRARLIDPLPGFTRTFPVDLNDTGTVLCRAEPYAGGPGRGYLWDDGAITELGTLGGEACLPLALDESGRVAGSSQLEGGAYQPFIWQQGVMTELALPGGYTGGEARDLLTDGQVGGSVTSATQRRAVLWVDGAPVLLPLLAPFTNSRVYGMAEGGYVVGACFPAPDQETRGRAVMWRDGRVTDLGALPGYSYSQARAVNTQGDVVCNSFQPPYPGYGSRYRNGSHTHLLGSIRSQGWDIDEAGVCVGDRDERRGYGSLGYFGYLWAGDRQRSLGSLVTGQPAPIRTVTAINNAGQLIAEIGDPLKYSSSGGAVLLSPEPVELAITLQQVVTPTAPGQTVTVRAVLSNPGEYHARNCEFTLYAPRWLSELSAQSDRATPALWGTNAVVKVDTLAPGETVTLELSGTGRAPGKYSFHTSSWHAGRYYKAETSFTLAGTPQADLAWLPASIRAVQYSAGRRFELDVDGEVKNYGTARTRPCTVRISLGDEPIRRRSDRLLRQLKIPALDPGDQVDADLSRLLPRSAAGKYVFLEIDSPNRIRETDETNNLAVTRVPP